MKIVAVNGTDRDWTRHRYILWFGEVSPTYLMVWANSLDDALEIAGDWLEEHAPGQFIDDAVANAYQEAREAGLAEDEAAEKSMEDTTSVCSGNHYLPSWTWGILCEDPDRKRVKELLGFNMR